MEVDIHDAPLVRAALPFAAGVVLALQVPLQSLGIAIGLVLLSVLLVALVLSAARWKYLKFDLEFGSLVLLCFFIAGILHASIDRRQALLETGSVPECEIYTAQVLHYPVEKRKTWAVDLILCECEIGEHKLSTPGYKYIAYLHKNLGLDSLIPGDFIAFSRQPSIPPSALNPGAFDFRQYLSSQGFSGTVYLDHITSVWRMDRLPFDPLRFFENLQQSAVRRMASFQLDSIALGIASALVLGERNLLDPDVKSDFTTAGVVHILAVSGLHVGIIYTVLAWLLIRFLPQQKFRWLRFALSLGFLWTYAGLTGFSPSVLRAATMFSFIALGKESKLRGNIYNMIAASALVLLIIRPSIIGEIGFQLSYSAVLGIVALYKPMYQLWSTRYWLLDKVWSLLIVSFAAQLATFPFIAHYFGVFPTYFLLTNLIVIPLATITLYLGLAVLVFSWVPWLASLLALFLQIVTTFLYQVVEVVKFLPMAQIESIYLSPLMVFISYALLVAVYCFWRWPQRLSYRSFVWIGAAAILVYGVRIIEHLNRKELYILSSELGAVPVVLVQRTAYVPYAPSQIAGEGTQPVEELKDFFRVKGVASISAMHPGELNRNFPIQVLRNFPPALSVFENTIFIFLPQAKAYLDEIDEYESIYLCSRGSKPHELSKALHSGTVILDHEMSEADRNAWKAYAEQHQVIIWDMKSQGFYRRGLP